jgi:TolA-binding protein
MNGGIGDQNLFGLPFWIIGKAMQSGRAAPNFRTQPAQAPNQQNQDTAAERQREAEARTRALLGELKLSDSPPGPLPQDSGDPSGLGLKLGDTAQSAPPPGANNAIVTSATPSTGSAFFGQQPTACPPSQNASVVDLCGLGDTVDPATVKGAGAPPVADQPPANPTLPTVAEIENSPGADDAHRAFQAIVDKDWPTAIKSFEEALSKDPNNAALKRSLELADYTEMVRRDTYRQNSPILPVIVVWRSGDDQTAIAMLKQIEQKYSSNHDLMSEADEVRQGIVTVEMYQSTPAYKNKLMNVAKTLNDLMVDGGLAMAQKSLVDQYVDDAMRYVAQGNLPQARLMLRTAQAEDESRGDVRALLGAMDSDHGPPRAPSGESAAAASNVHN